MLDHPQKTERLMTALKAALPFEVALMPDLIDYLAQQQNPVRPSQDSHTLEMRAASPVTFSLRKPIA
jgi:hypothetical protein